MTKQRDISLDIAKAIGIILMLAGHRLWDMPIHDVIYSFHMPLFFLIGGYLFKPMVNWSEYNERLYKDLRRLVLPYAITAGFVVLWWIGVALCGGENHILHRGFAAFWGAGWGHEARYLGNMPSIGAIWFLLAMFWCRQAYTIIDKVCDKFSILACVLIYVFAMKASGYIGLPWSIWDGLMYLPYYAVGRLYCQWHLQNASIIKKSLGAFIAFAMWVVCFVLNKSIGGYWHHIVFFLGAVGAGYAILILSKGFASINFSKFVSVVSWIGMNSMTILCLHLIDLDCRGLEWLGIDPHSALYVEIVLLPILTYLLSFLPLVKQIYGITDLKFENSNNA